MSGCGQGSLGFNDDAVGIVGSGSVGKAPKNVEERGGNGFKRLGDRLAQVTKRSPFSVWLSAGSNYERLTEQIDKYGVRWEEIAKWAVEENYTGGESLTAIAAKRAYERERKRRGGPAKRARRAKKDDPKAQALSSSPPPVKMLGAPDEKRESRAKTRLDNVRASMDKER